MNKRHVASVFCLRALGALAAMAGCGGAPATVADREALAARGAGDGTVSTAATKPVVRPTTTPPPPPSGGTSAAFGNVVQAPETAVIAVAPVVCSTTPQIFQVTPSVPPAGSGVTCLSDADCGTGEYCAGAFNLGTGACRSSGLLTRGSIYYVAGRTLDLDMMLSACASVTDVLQGGVSLGGSGGFDDTGKQYTILSSTPASFNGQDAQHVVVGINLLNFGDGSSSPFEVRVTAPLLSIQDQVPPTPSSAPEPAPSAAPTAATAGALTATAGALDHLGATASTTFTVAGVAATNGLAHATIGETKMRTDFLVSMYQEFGDADSVLKANDDGQLERKAHGLDWSTLGSFMQSNQIYYTGTDLSIQSGQVVFSMKFTGDAPGCDVDVDVDGAFTLVPARSKLQLQWLMGPRPRISADPLCTIATLGLYAIATDILVSAYGLEDSMAKAVQTQIEGSAGVDDSGFIPVCDTCIVQDVRITNGRIDIYTYPGAESVRVNVSTTRYTDTTTDPNGMGLAVPPGMIAIVEAGGLYQSCLAADGTSADVCNRIPLDGRGTFNWWGSDVPVPTPWPMNPQTGVTGYIGARANAWNRLIPLGVDRHADQLPAPTFPPGALLARRSGSTETNPTPRLRVTGGCRVDPDPTAGTPTKIAFGVNDLPSVGTEPPTSGQLDATVLLAADAGQSVTAFSGVTACAPAAPVPVPVTLATTVGAFTAN